MSDEFVADLAVVIGIGAYDAVVGRLETPVRDAEAVAHLLASRFGYQVILQCDGTATLEGLRTLLGNLKKRVLADSRLLVYFAGHGVALDSAELEGPQGYLVPHGATSEIKSHLPMRELYEALKRLPCRHLLVILDCCFSGSFRWASQRPFQIPGELLYEERYRHWVRHRARWALSSAGHDEYALDTPDRRRGQRDDHSPFAAALLDGLAGEADTRPKGGDGIITLAELYAYLQDRLVPHQSPLVTPLPGQTRGEFVFRELCRPLALQSAEIAVVLEPEANPYRGLEAYKSEHADRFFGRVEATRLLRSHVETRSWSVVVGPSGSGKSSLVHAGLLPCLRRATDTHWIAPPPFRVAGDSFVALRNTLVAAGSTLVAVDLRDPDQAEAWAASWSAAHPSMRMLLVVDQAEELVTHVARSESEEAGSLPKEAVRFLACLAALIRGGGGRVRAIVVVRSDYEADLDGGPHSSLWKAGRFIVPPLRREDLREIIEGPAAIRALYFEDPRLVDRLVDEVWGMPGGLPLLSYALSRLFLAYVKKARGDRLLTCSDLAAIGGGAGGEGEGNVAPGVIFRILRDGADKAVDELPQGHRETLWRVLLRMVHLVGTRTTRRQVPQDELVYPDEAEDRRVKTVCAHLIDHARLLVSSQDGGRDLIEPAHDELLVAWPELVRRIDGARVRLPVHRRLTEAAAGWSTSDDNVPDHRRKRDLDLRLLNLVETSDLPEDWFNKAESDYVTAARRARWRRNALRWIAGVTTLLVTTGAALFFRDQSRRNEKLMYQAAVPRLINQGDADRENRRPTRAMLLTLQAFEFNARSRGDRLLSFDYLISRTLDLLFYRSTDVDLTNRVDGLFRRLLDDMPPNRVVLRNHEDSPGPVVFHPSGRLLAAGHEKTLVLMTLLQHGIQEIGLPRPLPGAPEEALSRIAFSTDGKILTAGYAAGSLCAWRLADTPPAPVPEAFACTPHATGDVTGLGFRPGTATLVVGREIGKGAGSIQIWEVADGPKGTLRLQLRMERRTPGAVRDLAVSAAGEIFVSIQDTNQVLRSPIEDMIAPFQPLEPTGGISNSIGFDISGRHLIGTVTGRSGAILVGRLPDAASPPLSRSLLSAGADRILKLEDDGRRLMLPSLCEGSVTQLAVDPWIDRVAISCDGVLRLWDLRSAFDVWIQGIGRWRLIPSEGATFLAKGGPGTQLAVGKASGDVDVYDLDNGERWTLPRPLFAESDGRTADCNGVAASFVGWSATNKFLHVLSQDGLWRTHTATGDNLSRRLNGCVCAAAESSDGIWLAVLLQNGPGEINLMVVPTSGDREEELLTSLSTVAGWCDIGLAFHPDRIMLAAGIESDITLWTPSSEGRWQSRNLGRTSGRITTAVWAGDYLVVGGVDRPNENGFIDVFDKRGNRWKSWVLRETPVNRLAFEPMERLLAVATNGGGLQIWDLDMPDAPQASLGEGQAALLQGNIEFPVFLDSSRIAALDDYVSLWRVGPKILAEAACATVPSNLQTDDWTTYVDADLSRYELTCPGGLIGPHPSLLAYADSLASQGNEKAAKRFYRRVNELSHKSIVKDPARRARAQQLYHELSEFDATDKQGILAALERANEYNTLRRTEGLLPLRLIILKRLCRRGVIFGEAQRALQPCGEALELMPGDGSVSEARGLARALLGEFTAAREDLTAARDWLDDPDWLAQHQGWIDALDAGYPPILPILRQIAREELKTTPPDPLPNITAGLPTDVQ